MNKREYLLGCLAEECGEVTQMIGKSLRFGLENKKQDRGTTNFEELKKEVHDIMACYIMLCEEIDECSAISIPLINQKKSRVEYFMNSSRKHGHLQD